MNKELPEGWALDRKGCVGDYLALTVPTEPYILREFVDPDYSKMPVPPVYGPGDCPEIPSPPKDLGKWVEEKITEGVLIAHDYAVAPISPDKLVYHDVSSVGVSPMTHNPTHIVLRDNSNSVSVTLVPIWKPVGNYHLMSSPGGSSTMVYNPIDVVHRKKLEDKANKEDYANAYNEKVMTVAVETAFNRFQNIIDEGRYRIHVFVKDLEDMIFFEEVK